ncbi:MAG: DUF3047 domain-containing protein [Pseudomonadales bacterium]
MLALLSGCQEAEPPTASQAAASGNRTTISIDNAMAGWQSTGLQVQTGDYLALFGAGDWDADGLSLAPRHLLWYRIGDQGTATNFSADEELAMADSAGEVFVAVKPPGIYWTDDYGTFPPEFLQAPPVPLAVTVEAIRFQGSLEEGLQRLADSGDLRAADALHTLSERKSLPAGFFYLPYLGRSNVWADGTVDGKPGIQADTTDDVGIVKLPLDIPLTDTTEIRFDWRYDSLPALGPETEAQFHDYLSIALEFDNGQDLTWMWSPTIEAGTHFHCPLPWWDSRETHYVIQSGVDGLGSWHSHQRNVLSDYRDAIEVPGATRIVGVWFIANSLFGRQRAAASFARVSVTDGAQETVIFGP